MAALDVEKWLAEKRYGKQEIKSEYIHER
jgi:hypothetical protein